MDQKLVDRMYLLPITKLMDSELELIKEEIGLHSDAEAIEYALKIAATNIVKSKH